MKPYKPVTVSAAVKIAETFEKSRVVILSYDTAHELTHVTTYGTTPEDKLLAASAGDACAAVVGCDLNKITRYEDFGQIDVATAAMLLRQADGNFERLLAEDELNRREGSPVIFTDIELAYVNAWRAVYAKLQSVNG
jgi:hypothetical protein